MTLDWEGSSTSYSPTTEIPYVTAELAKHVNALVLSPTNAQALVPEVQSAKKDGIPVVCVDAYTNDTSDLVTRIAGDNTGGGQQAAKLLADAIGDSGQVLLLDSSAGVTSDDQRSAAFVATNAQTIIQQQLSRYPDLKGVFAVDDVTAEGTIAELQDLGTAGAGVKVISYDAEAAQVTALEADKLVGLIAQQPALEGQIAVEDAVLAAQGKAGGIAKVDNVPNVTITYANYATNEQYFYSLG